MKFTVVVYGAPFTDQASHSALGFANAVLARGHELYRVFFYHDGVYNGSSLLTPPQDENHIGNDWQALANERGVELVLCIASALRRGILDPSEASRYEKAGDNVAPGFTLAGLGQLIEAGLESDRVVTFAR